MCLEIQVFHFIHQGALVMTLAGQPRTPTVLKTNLNSFFIEQNSNFLSFKLRWDSRFQHAFTACSCAFKVITLIGSNLGNYFENATKCNKRMLKTRVATKL